MSTRETSRFTSITLWIIGTMMTAAILGAGVAGVICAGHASGAPAQIATTSAGCAGLAC